VDARHKAGHDEMREQRAAPGTSKLERDHGYAIALPLARRVADLRRGLQFDPSHHAKVFRLDASSSRESYTLRAKTL
jgi:hypothetical protein